MICTVPKLTQSPQKSNNFVIPSGKLATRGFFEEKIKYEQWHIFRELRKHTRNVNVINLASLLAVLPRMGMYAYEITQAELAETMARFFDLPVVPSRRTISSWENQLSKLGYVDIPNHVDWRNSKTKIRVLTEKFWILSRAGLPELSYICPHGTFCTGKVERVEHYTPEELTDKLTQTEIRGRARDNMVGAQPIPGRAIASHENKIQKGKPEKPLRPPKRSAGVPRKLTKFQNSIMWWVFQNSNLESYREGVILFARFLESPGDEYCEQLEKNWKYCGDASRPGLITGLIKYLRTIEPATGPDTARPPLQLASMAPESLEQILPAGIVYDPPDKNCPSENTGIADKKVPDAEKLIAMMRHGRPCHGEKFAPLVYRYRSANMREKQFIIDHVNSLVLVGTENAIKLLDNYRAADVF